MSDQLSLSFSFEVRPPAQDKGPPAQDKGPHHHPQSERKNISPAQIVRAYIDGETPIKLRMLIDWGEPTCWACGYYKNAHYCDATESELKHPTTWITNSWGRACKVGPNGRGKGFLERAHIIPHSLGGASVPSNYLLLCKRCHSESPDTTSLAMMQYWIDRVEPRSEYEDSVKRGGDLLRVMQHFEVDMDDLDGVYIFEYEDGERYPIKFTAEYQRYLDNNVALHGGKISDASFAAALRSFQLRGDHEKNPT